MLFIVENIFSLNPFIPLFYIFYLFPSFGFKNLFAIRLKKGMKKEREVKNWFFLIQELHVICQPDRKKWPRLYLIRNKNANENLIWYDASWSTNTSNCFNMGEDL